MKTKKKSSARLTKAGHAAIDVEISELAKLATIVGRRPGRLEVVSIDVARRWVRLSMAHGWRVVTASA